MDNDTSSLLNQLYRLEWLLRRKNLEQYRGYGPWSAPYRGQGRVLALLKLHPEISQKDLGTVLGIRSQSLGELLGKLERQGFITREPSDGDKRAMIIRLTEAGREAAEKQAAPSDPEAFADCLSEEERESFASYLRRIIENLEAELGVESGDPEDLIRDLRRGLGGMGGRPGGFRDGGPYGPRRRELVGIRGFGYRLRGA